MSSKLKRCVREQTLEDRCVRFAKKRGWLVRKMNGLGFRSWPDRLFVPSRARARAGVRPFWVEFKRLGQKPTPLQRKIHRDLTSRCETVHVIDSYDDFIQLLQAIIG